MIWHWLEGKREDLAPFSSPRGNLPAREAGDLLHHGTSQVSSIYKSRPTSSPICGRSHCSSATSSCDDLWTHQRCCCSCSWVRRSGHPPAAHGSAAASTPVPSEMPASTTKKADPAQPPHGRAPVQSPTAQSAPASVRTAASHGAMDGAQQVVEESPTRFLLYIVTSFCNSV